ncbi:thiol reductant ABC exporter subunit CydC [Modestobacter sp. VKM Ac-2979]|uniref:thiol reductant ABC exporter subunit CydC n=1 Tax=unclassified Modestobacter TaxID=2643866 RepID=UPI0022AB9910|nr:MULTISPECIES: thiol reductant ABC exporter subunit CydC [unclassified Modestobacter]MCZ2814244.1 thiol reductant ABC exporter subunit CydC [Modestobacter sp. VKM Ac-2979]MCZ2844064.1 thiol reductant ABC exporter subunit CydC [Modestobacter sp. VKM Ac-2980]
MTSPDSHQNGHFGGAERGRGPLGPLAGVPGLTGALVRAAVAALGQTVGVVLLAAGLARAVADVADGVTPGTSLLVALLGVGIRAAAGGLGSVLATRDARRAEDTLRRRLLTRLLAGEGEAVAAAGGSGPAAVLASTRLHDLGPALATYLPALAQTIVVPPVLLVVLGLTDWLSALLVAVTLPLVPLFMALVGLHTRDRTVEAARALDRIAGHVAELVRGLPVLVGLGRAADQLSALADLGETHRRRTLATLRIAFLSSLVLEVLATLSVALVAVTVGVRLVHGDMGLDVGLLALLLAPEAFAPLRALGAAHHASEDAAEAAAEARAVLAAPAPRPVLAAPPAGQLRGVTVDGLTVSFPGRSRPAVDGASFEVAPGELVALRGPSGSGKSTVLAVLAGQLLDGATAQVDGVVLAPADVAVVPQFPHTVADTVLDELRRHAGDVPDEWATDLADTALAWLDAGHLRERACRTLSPGELQRVALARALVRVQRGARVLLLDEPTASLDAASTAQVAELLVRLRGSLCTVLVTHSPALAALADRAVDLTGPDALPPLTTVPAPERTGSTEDAGAPLPAALAEPGAAPEADRGTAGLSWPRRAVVRAVAAGSASAASAVALTAVSGWLIVRAAEQPPILTLLVATAGVRGFGLARAGLRWLERLAGHDAAFRLASSTRLQVWRALVAQGPAADRTPGRALARVVGDVGLLQDLSVRVVTPPLVSGIVLVGTTAVLALLDPRAGALVAALVGVAVLGVLGVHRRADRGSARYAAELRTVTLRETSAALEAAGDLRAHGLTGEAVDRLDQLGRRQGRAARAGATATALGDALAVLATGAAAVGALAVAAVGVRAGELSAPTAAVLALAPLALLEPLTALGAAQRHRLAWHDAQARVESVLAEPVAADPAPAERVAPPRPVRELALEQLTAGWPGRPAVLRDLDAVATAGSDWLVVTGPSGSGKSTLLSVLMASLRPAAGAYVLGDGRRPVPADRLTRADVQGTIAWCPQEAHVFDAPLRANLALARPRGELAGADGEEAMRRALTDAGLGALLASLPAGLDTPVGAGGTSLSGGERRRLAVARALLADRDVVLLDEPTAHLDPPTAAALVADLRRALAGRLVVCVTHDPAVAEEHDSVLRLDGMVPEHTPAPARR